MSRRGADNTNWKKSFMITRLVALAAPNNNSSSTPRELVELNISRVPIHTLSRLLLEISSLVLMNVNVSAKCIYNGIPSLFHGMV